MLESSHVGLSIFKAVVVKSPVYSKCTGNFYSLITSLSSHQMKWFRYGFVQIFKRLLMMLDFTLIDNCMGL